MPQNDAIYSVQNLRKDFSLNGELIHVLKGLSFQIARGQWAALTGPSGCGKTTLLQLLGGLDRPSAGSILFSPVTATNQKAIDFATASQRCLTRLRKSSIGFVFQSYQLLPELTALENAALPALRWGTNRLEIRERAKALLSQFGLEHRLSHLPQELSGGEQQRVAIARALINSPEVILADEPTGNLDKKSAAQIIEILQTIHTERKMTIVMVTHDTSIAALADENIHI